MPNRLAQESSPYLLQHANNPVDWYPWGPEALAKAQAENKPIFLSIGYSACHWCHVMEHESFEDDATAQIMNELFVNIKVDREERPDIDSIYMDAVVALTGHGGWPMSVFLTPTGVPFYGGTYFPPSPRHGMPSFEQILRSVAHAFVNQSEDVDKNAFQLMTRINAAIPLTAEGSVEPAVLNLSVQAMAQNFDWHHGGMKGSPKFPQPMTYEFLLRAYHSNPQQQTLNMVELTLQKMATGGMYDQLGGGFHRYSVDAVWLVPHFEKMLYDNALLARVYLHAYQVTENPFYRRIVVETLDYVIREMTDPQGGFYSTQDADSEGEEGKFFLWSPEEIKAVIGDKYGEVFCAVYDVRPGGNFEGKSILNIPRPLQPILDKYGLSDEELVLMLDESRVKLFEARETRIKPARDEKILTSWNGLMMAAFAEAGRVLDRPDYTDVAVKNAEFILATMLKEGRLFRTWKASPGEAKLMGYLEDYAFYADALLALYQTTFDPRWFQTAQQLVEVILTHFPDETNGGFFDTADDHEALVSRPKTLQDNAIPSGNAMTLNVLLQLAAFTAQDRYAAPAHATLAGLQQVMSQYPAAFAHWLTALAFATSQPKEIALMGSLDTDSMHDMLNMLHKPYRPNQVVAATLPDDTTGHPDLVLDRSMQNGETTAYVCQNFTCQQPVTTVEALESLL